MLDRGFAPDVERIIAATPSDRQTALFSATTPPWVQEVAHKYLRQPQLIQVGAPESEPDIEHSVVEVWDGDKMSVLIKLLEQPSDGGVADLRSDTPRRNEPGAASAAAWLRGRGATGRPGPGYSRPDHEAVPRWTTASAHRD